MREYQHHLILTTMVFGAASAMLVACNGVTDRQELSTETLSVTPVRQLEADAVVVPSASNEQPWMGRLDLMTRDGTTGHLFALDWLQKRVVEFDSSGRPIRFFGGDVGEGPGQVQNPFAYDVTEDAVHLLDEGSNRILIYRRDGELRDEFLLNHSYTELGVGSSRRIYVIPSSREGLVDVLVPEDDSLRLEATLGSPELHDDHRCRVGCKLDVDEQGRIVLLQGTVPRVLLLDEQGAFEMGAALQRLPLVQEWIQEEQEILARHDLPEGASGSKTFVWQLSRTSNGVWVLPFLPPRVGTRPRQLWLLSPDFESVQRYEFDRVSLGNSIVVTGNTVFALDVENGGLYRASIPGE